MANMELKGSHGTNQDKCMTMPGTPIIHAFTPDKTCIHLMCNIQLLPCFRAYIDAAGSKVPKPLSEVWVTQIIGQIISSFQKFNDGLGKWVLGKALNQASATAQRNWI